MRREQDDYLRRDADDHHVIHVHLRRGRDNANDSTLDPSVVVVLVSTGCHLLDTNDISRHHLHCRFHRCDRDVSINARDLDRAGISRDLVRYITRSMYRDFMDNDRDGIIRGRSVSRGNVVDCIRDERPICYIIHRSGDIHPYQCVAK